MDTYHPAYVTSKKICPFEKIETCLYQTQGQIICNGPLTQGAIEKSTTQKLYIPPSDQLFQRVLDEKTTWR
jgi:hypothetical protein